MIQTIWAGCYSPGWDKEDLVEAAWSHPAKFAKGLIFRLIQHLVRQGYVSDGSLVCDPFGGVALGALPCMAYGLHYLGCELEPRFQEIGETNIALWHQRYGFTGGRIVQGDSRFFRAVLQRGQAHAVISSPPYATSLSSDKSREVQRWNADGLREHHWGAMARGANSSDAYGTTPGQLGAMKPGTLADAVVSSPPYAASLNGPATGIDWEKAEKKWGRKSGKHSPGKDGVPLSYGKTPGQLGGMKPGEIDAVVSSPPFGNSLESKDAAFNAKARPGRTIQRAEYGDSQGQLGAEPLTFWAAASAILSECYAILRPGGVAAFVLKDYVSKGKTVPFCDQWRQLCEAQGFVLIEEIHASLVEQLGTQETLFGEAEIIITEKKSFFRRLYEKRPHAHKIDYEVVLILKKA